MRSCPPNTSSGRPYKASDQRPDHFGAVVSNDSRCYQLIASTVAPCHVCSLAGGVSTCHFGPGWSSIPNAIQTIHLMESRMVFRRHPHYVPRLILDDIRDRLSPTALRNRPMMKVLTGKISPTFSCHPFAGCVPSMTSGNLSQPFYPHLPGCGHQRFDQEYVELNADYTI